MSEPEASLAHREHQMPESYSARQRLFRSSLFQDQVADRLELDRGLVYPAINAMVHAGMVPCRLSRNEKALAVDGAMILAAIGGRQALEASIVRVGCTLCAMAIQHEIEARPTYSQLPDQSRSGPTSPRYS